MLLQKNLLISMINDASLNVGKDRRSEILFYATWNVNFYVTYPYEYIRRIQSEPQMAEEIFV